MGLAPYGDKTSDRVKLFKEKILNNLIDIKKDGSVLLNMKYFDYASGQTMTNDKKWEELFSLKRRKKESKKYKNISYGYGHMPYKR